MVKKCTAFKRKLRCVSTFGLEVSTQTHRHTAIRPFALCALFPVMALLVMTPRTTRTTTYDTYKWCSAHTMPLTARQSTNNAFLVESGGATVVMLPPKCDLHFVCLSDCNEDNADSAQHQERWSAEKKRQGRHINNSSIIIIIETTEKMETTEIQMANGCVWGRRGSPNVNSPLGRTHRSLSLGLVCNDKCRHRPATWCFCFSCSLAPRR